MDPVELTRLNDLLEKENDLRESQAKELSKSARLISSILDRVHTTPFPNLLDSVDPIIESTRNTIVAIVVLVPPNQMYKFNGTWAAPMRSLLFSASLCTYLRSGDLITITGLEEIFALDSEWKDRFSIPTEDYLHAIISLVNELSRLAINSVTMSEFDRPLQISSFARDVFSGFTMLNLKNDSLRRRFDSLKYDLKKIEEVVYDVSLRKLNTSSLP
ncbi:Translin [Flagelloscypha sp. PMI_526]|nr:Translin [Flagelloscypha sp. PMI_526]